MISHDLKCIFIHIPKTAGSAIELALDGRDWSDFEDPSKDLHHPDNVRTFLHKHLSVDEARKVYFNEWKSYFKFTVVRNPWDWVWSSFKNNAHRYGIPFEKFVMDGVILPSNAIDANWSHKWMIPQTRWLTPFCRYWMPAVPNDPRTTLPMINGNFKDDHENYFFFLDGKNEFGQYINDVHVIKFEDVQEGINNVGHILGVKESLVLPRYNVSSGPGYMTQYTQEMASVVARMYAEDIKNFGYTFDNES